jgi:hypothetical protein
MQKERFQRGEGMASKSDAKSLKPANNTCLHAEDAQRSFEQVKGLIEKGVYRIDLRMIAVTLARLLKEQKSITGSYMFPPSSY